ncbi:MAG: response regulator [Deltaproteobacteria bacterium]|nr:response regulator [Deltaproteobacteria bacterium]
MDEKKPLKNSYGLEGREYLNPKRSLFSSKNQFEVMDEDIKVVPNHPLISMFDDHRSSASIEQIEEWMIDHNMFLETGDRLLQSELILPVYFEENLICLILFGNKIDGTIYSTDEKEFVQRLGLSLGPCIENANLLEKFERKVEERTSELQTALEETRIKEQEISRINQVVQAVNSTLDLDKVMVFVQEAIQSVFSFDHISIQLLDPKRKTLQLQKAYGDSITEEHLTRWKTLNISIEEKNSLSTFVVYNKKPVYFSGITDETPMLPLDKQIWAVLPFVSILMLPLEVQNQTIGCVTFYGTTQEFDLSQKNISRAQQYVSQVATAINNARLAEETQLALLETKAKEHEIAHINQVIQTVNSTLDLDKVTATVGEALREVFQFNQMSIQLIDEETQELVFIKIYGDESPHDQLERVKSNRISLNERHSVFVSPVIRKKPLYLPNISPEMVPLMVPCDREIYRMFSAKAYLFVPLEIQNQIIGVMGFGNTKAFFNLNKSDLEKIQRFVPQVATAINNARLAGELKLTNEYLKSEIKERQKAVEALSESEEKYRNILDNMEDLYTEFDLAGNFVFFNQATVVSLDCKPDELMNKNCKEFMDDVAARRVFDEFHEVFLTDKPKLIGWEIITKTGRKLYVEGFVSLQKDSEGKPIGFRGVIRDVTLKRNAEMELKKAKEAAEATTKSKSEFLANMSHEIRTPMNAILGTTELLSEASLPFELMDYVKTINSSGELLLSIINDILDFSKIEAGQMALEETTFDLRDLVETAGKILAVKAHEKKLELNCRVAMDVQPFRIGDPTRLRQIFINLLNNAIKFTDYGEVVLDVEHLDDPELLQFCVRDTGIGIPKEKQQLIFDSFSQVDTSVTRKYGGTGLGLAICKRLVELTGGHIWIESEEGRGTRFFFTARLPKAEQIPSCVIASPAELEGMDILVVDDNETNRQICRELLSAWGATVSESESGARAIQAIADADKNGKPFHMILLDLRMPEMDGFQVAERINTMAPSLTCLPRLVMLTSSDAIEEKARARELNIASYIVKPYRRVELLEGILIGLGKKEKIAEYNPSVRKFEKMTLPTMRILIAEDIEPNRKLMKQYLKNSPITIDMAENGRIAMEKYTRNRYDLVLMDIEMPEMDGFSATRAIRKWEQETGRDKTPVLALTAHAFREHREKCFAAGCSGYLTKPIKKQLLIEKILQFARAGAIMDQDGEQTCPDPTIETTPDTTPDKIDDQKNQRSDYIVKIDAELEALIPDFMAHTKSDLTAMSIALEKQDSETLRRIGHSLKGSAMMYEFTDLGKLGMVIEEAAKGKDLIEIEKMLEKLKHYLDCIQIEYI